MSDIHRTRIRRLADGHDCPFAGRDDYVMWLMDTGQYVHMDDPVRGAELEAEICRTWMGDGQTSCEFAASMAEGTGWTPLIVAQPNREVLRQTLDGLLIEYEGRTEIVQIIFPYVSGATGLTGLINDLCSTNQWSWAEHPGADDELLLSLEYQMVTQRYASFALGFGQFEFLPFTRQGPYTAIVLCLHARMPHNRYPRSDGLVPLYVQDAASDLDSAAHVMRAASTIAIKANILNGEFEQAASMDIAFRIPRANAYQLLKSE